MKVRVREVAVSVVLVALACAGEGVAAPHIPASDAAVVERVPASAATRDLMPFRQALRLDPDDLPSALQLAQGYIEIGRATSDPRFVSYAQAVLARWMRMPQPPASVLVLQATALQNMHRFDEALALLDAALRMEPQNAQAWLTKATLLQVQGRFSEARAACQQLFRRADQVVALTCLMAVDSLNGGLARSYEALGRIAATHAPTLARKDGEVAGWISGQLAEMAIRLGEDVAAERHFKEALRADPASVYLQAAYADLLLSQARTQETIDLLKDGASHDVLLLRLAIAARRVNASQAQQWQSTFDARRRAARPDDNPHLREHARFMLDVLADPAAALVLARKNWELQREPADVQIYLRAASAAGSATDERVVRAWIRETGFEDAALNAASLRAQR